MPVPSTASVPTLKQPKSYTATQCILTLKVNGKGTTVPKEGMHQFVEGTNIYINAVVSEGWQFIGWVGGVDEPYTQGTNIIMDTEKIVATTFQLSE